MSRPRTAADVRQALSRKYTGNAYEVLFEVRNGTGHAANRSADALVMSLWPSRGLDLMGFEIKVRRSDWKRELKDGAKADAIAQWCDQWWIAASPGVVDLDVDPFPTQWGLMVLDDSGRLATIVKAPALNPPDLPRPMLAALLRASHNGYISADDHRRIVEEARAAAADGTDLARENAALTRRVNELEGLLNTMAEETGIDLLHGVVDDLRYLSGAEIVRALATLIKANRQSGVRQLQHAHAAAERSVQALEEAIAALQQTALAAT